MLNQQEFVVKYCEYCGIQVHSPYWSAIFSIEYVIFLNNPLVKSVDYQKQTVYLTDGNVIDFLFRLNNETLGMPYRAKIHLLCSENCENQFILANRGGMISASLQEKTPIFNYREAGIFKPISVVMDKLRTIIKTCEICGLKYPDFDIEGWEKKWISEKIIKKDRIRGKLNATPSFNMDYYDQILSGINKRSPEGFFYAYKFSDNQTIHSFCSTDCAFIYSSDNNSAIIIDSVLEKDRIGIIVPETEEINKNLGNPMPHRPSFFGQL